MISYVWTGLILIACVTAVCLGRTEELSVAVTDGAANAVTLCLTMIGLLGLWSGVMELMEQAGITQKIARLLLPVLSKLFPSANHRAKNDIASNITANLLGLSNAATPFGLKAAEEMYQTMGDSDELLRFLVLNTTSIQLIPTTVAAVRAMLGAQNPFDIMPAIWGASALSVATGLLAAAILAKISRWGKQK
ncbi:MAG: nucleoside recognition domain-containing protein [Eubacteriales bacterium]|nr:nucleoside recognition domain-containing protein [Eubacteriales bacterium]